MGQFMSYRLVARHDFTNGWLRGHIFHLNGKETFHSATR